MEESVVPRDPGLAIIYDMLESEHGGSSTSQQIGRCLGAARPHS